MRLSREARGVTRAFSREVLGFSECPLEVGREKRGRKGNGTTSPEKYLQGAGSDDEGRKKENHSIHVL